MRDLFYPQVGNFQPALLGSFQLVLTEAAGPQHRIEPVLLKACARRQGIHVVDGHGRLQVPGCSG